MSSSLNIIRLASPRARVSAPADLNPHLVSRIDVGRQTMDAPIKPVKELMVRIWLRDQVSSSVAGVAYRPRVR